VTPESLVNRLHDIHELDPVSAWPLATGWWLLLAFAALVVLLYLVMRRWRPDWRRYLPRYGWTRDAARELTELRDQVAHGEIKELADRFSELLRRIAIARCGREHCAGLHGEPWLAWLKDHDPEGFDWLDGGSLLLDLPYAPPGEQGYQREMRLLIDAAMVWTSRPGECLARQETADGV